ncbi:MAG: septum formation inhibitor Maf [Gammaproteobacteria bacterium]|nr:septum formation inhibitor Maf [Gammaproteobacteria bacterium]
MIKSAVAVLRLASASPRRRELLEQIGLCVDVVAADIDERLLPGESAASYVERLARHKAQTVFGRQPDLPVLAADTAIVLDDVVFGKPDDAQDAARMLAKLSGKTHKVLTGTAIVYKGKTSSVVVTTRVTFAALSDTDIDAYCATGEPIGKAGAYAIQGLGAILVQRIQGSYSNVVGLPLYETARLLAPAGIDVLEAARQTDSS